MSGRAGERGFAELPDDLPQALRGALDELRVADAPRAREDFRVALRADFISGRIALRTSLIGVLDGWRAPDADPAFRARLRERFLAETSATAPAAREPRAILSAPRGKRATPARRSLALAAAVLLAAALWLLLPRWGAELEGWRVLEGSPAGLVLMAQGLAVPTASEGPLVRALHEGDCSLRTSKETLRVLRSGRFLISLGSDSEVRVLPRAERGDDLLVIELVRGGLQVATAAGEERRMRVVTPDLEIELRGRAVAVDVYPGQGSCVCNLDGQVALRPRGAPDGPPRLLQPGKAWFQPSPEEAREVEIPAAHRRPLEELLEVAARHSRLL